MRFTRTLLSAACLAAVASTASEIIAPELSDWGARPVVDGVIRPNEYRGCSRQPLMFGLHGVAGNPAGYFDIGIWEGRYLCFAFETRAMTRMPKVADGRRDGALWEHDGIEVHFKIGGDHIQLIVDSDGNIFDSKNGDASWNAPWQVAAAPIGTEFAVDYAGGGEVPERGFLVEVSLDMQGIIDLNKPARLQVVLNRAGEGAVGFWEPFTALLIKDSQFGRLTWRGPTMRIDKLEIREGGRKVRFAGADSYAAGLTVTGPSGRAAGDRWSGNFDTEITLAGGAEYTVEIREEGDFHNILTFPLTAKLSVPVIAVNLPSRRAIYLEYDPEKLDADARFPLTLEFRRGDTVFETIFLDPAAGRRELFVPWSDWGAGEAALAIADAAGNSRGVIHLNLDPATPEWFDWRMPETALVPPPWTPVVATAESLEVWGRRFGFGGSPFVDRIASQGEELLAGPVELRAVVGGRPVAWRLTGWELVEAKEDCARYRSTSTSAEGLELTVEATVEFDGCARFDFTLTPAAGDVTVDRLAWVLPVRRRMAELFMHYTTQNYTFNDTSTWNRSGVLPAEGLANPFTSFFWLGTEKAGIQWFAEDAAGWYPADPGRAIEVKPSGDRAELILHLADAPLTLDRPLSYTMGLMPSPVRPRRHNDIQGNRILVLSSYRQLNGRIGEYGFIQIPIPANDLKPDGSLEARVRLEPGWEAVPEIAIFTHGNSQGNRQYLKYRTADRKLVLTHRTGTHGDRTLAEAPVEFTPGRIHTLVWNYGRQSALFLDGAVLFTGEDSLPAPTFDYYAQDTLGGDGFVSFGQWRSSRGHRAAADSRPDAVWRNDAATRHLSDLSGNPTLGRMVRPLNGNVACPAYLDGDWQYLPGETPMLVPARREPVTSLEHFADLGVRGAVFFEWANSPCGHDGVADAAGFRESAERARAAGMALIPYAPWGYTSHDPIALTDWRHEIGLAGPGAEPSVSWRESERIFYRGNSGEVSVRRLLWDYDRMFKLGAGGLYFDGAMYPTIVSSAIAGLPPKYDPLTGREVPVTRIFAHREFMKQVARLANHHLGGAAIIDAHASAGATLPTMSFATDSTNGESLAVFGNNWSKVLTVDTFATEFHATQYGFNSDALLYQGSPVPSEHGIALAAIHGQLPRPILWGLFPSRGQGIWGIVDGFDTQSARWFSYRDPARPLRVSDPRILASMWVHPDGRTLIMAANWGDAEIEARFYPETAGRVWWWDRGVELPAATNGSFAVAMPPKWLHIFELKK